MNVGLLLSMDGAVGPMVPKRALRGAALPSQPPPRVLADRGGDPSDLARQRWAVVGPDGHEDRLRRLLAPLLDLRQAEMGAEARWFSCPPALDAKGARRWLLERFRMPEGERPRYLLLVGDYDTISPETERALSGDFFPGRLVGEEEELASYAKKVATWAGRGLPVVERSLFVDDDGPACVTARPLVNELRTAADRRGRHEAVGQRLTDLGRVSGVERALVWSVSHGLGVPRDGARARALQGALALDGGRLNAELIRGKVLFPGGIWWMFACFGAGTPGRSLYDGWLKAAGELRGMPGAEELGQARRDALACIAEGAGFVAALPKALLASPDGPLAVVGHTDLLWTWTMEGGGERPSIRRYVEALSEIARGRRIGAALGTQVRAFVGELNDQILERYQDVADGRPESEEDALARIELWLARNDLLGWQVLGDPAVRLA